MTDSTCAVCGGPPDDVVEVRTVASADPVRRIPIFACHRQPVPPPTPEQLRRRAEDEWLRRQRDLAEDPV